jgi:tetratricopeptide (TPR) repeat protein
MARTLALQAALRASAVLPTDRAHPDRAAPSQSPLLPTVLPFVGRCAETARMESAWADGRAIFIEGDAGVGKSRLAVEFAAAHGPYALVRCRSGDSELPYAAYTRALRTLMGDASAVDGLPQWVKAELARLLPELGTPPPALHSSVEHARFVEACAVAWLRLAGESFDAVILDDWHCADAASRTLLGLVAQQRHDSGGMGARELVVYRDDLDAPARQVMLRLRDAVRAEHLNLQALRPDSVLELLQRLSGAECPTRLASRLCQATGGNPFFLAETLRHLAEQGVLAADTHGVWRTPFDGPARDSDELPVPAVVRDAVLARVGRLPDAAARVIEAAALAGEPFSAALLAPACALSEIDAVLAIEQAVQAHLLREHETGGYAFAHDLVRQALDSDLSTTRRNLVHRRLALGAEAAGAPPITVARHLEACGEASRAVVHRMAAGDAAQRVHALAEALVQWQQALDNQPRPGEAMQVHLRMMRTTYQLDRPEASAAHAQALLHLAEDERLANHERAEALLAVAQQRHEIAEPFDCLVAGVNYLGRPATTILAGRMRGGWHLRRGRGVFGLGLL